MNDKVFNVMNRLRCEAEYQDTKYGKGRYKWELGVDVFLSVQSDLLTHVHYISGDIDIRGNELMGIPVDEAINYKEPNLIRLWREVSV